MIIRIPTLTHLQFFVLVSVLNGEKSGKDLRKLIAGKQSGPAFYQMMKRLERTGFIEGRYCNTLANGRKVKERNYRITSKGYSACRVSWKFYSELQ